MISCLGGEWTGLAQCSEDSLRTRLLSSARYQGQRRQFPHRRKQHGVAPLRRKSPAICATAAASAQRRAPAQGIEEGYWTWRDFKIRYQNMGTSGPKVLLVHGFGSNCDHWRKNFPVVAERCQVWAIDLLGYGWSDKPDPRDHLPNSLYTFETWGQQLLDFMEQKMGGDPAFLICNSVGGLAGLQAAIFRPDLVRGVQLMNISLRLLHLKKQPAWKKPVVKALQTALHSSFVGPLFFSLLAKPQTVKNVLAECYGDKSIVTDELVDYILTPGLEPGAVRVFLDFISYSGGPLPEELLDECKRPVSILWGEKDPWEKLELGRGLQHHACVEEFVVLPGAGHCPMDEAPGLVNPAILNFIDRHT
ncbi:hypothetical protein WJX84_007219 [Apatococcus fuscideae]|uniref:AB hydrolase-1 domain-containing protein n=1 Tax=Apatococcus fuscideae TaxID=2026836 RepID=A0AAW1TL08_9CHLO